MIGRRNIASFCRLTGPTKENVWGWRVDSVDSVDSVYRVDSVDRVDRVDSNDALRGSNGAEVVLQLQTYVCM